MKSAGKEAELVAIGRIANYHSRFGEAKVVLLTDFPERFTEFPEVIVDGKTLKIESIRPHKEYLLIKFEGFSSIDDVLPLKGKEIQIPADERAELPEDLFYISDIVGCTVIYNGKKLGIVRNIHCTPATDMLVIDAENGEEAYLPFSRELFTGIDLEKKELTVNRGWDED